MSGVSSLERFLTRICDLEVRLWVESGRLRCRAPRGVLTAELRREIAAHKDGILAFLRQGVNLSDTSRSAIPTAPRAADLPASFAQQRLWFLDQMSPGNCAYNMRDGLRLRGQLDAGALTRALGALVERHEVLRTTLHGKDGDVVQKVNAPEPVAVPRIDLSSLAPEDRRRCLTQLAQQETETPFSLAEGPILRARLLRLAEAEHVLLFTVHHVASDGWSMSLIAREVATVYSALVDGVPAVQAPLPIQYADFATWQRRWLTGELLDAQLGFWRQRLADLAPLNLPTDHPRPSRLTFRGAVCRRRLPADLRARLEELARREEATLFMVMLTLFQSLLGRYSAQDDVAVGAPIANRNRRETEGLVGFFVNTLVMRGDLTGDPTVRGALHRLRDHAMEAYSHQDLPFEKLIEDLEPEREAGRNPLFEVTFALHNTPRPEIAMSGLESTLLELEITVTRFDLELHVWSDGDDLQTVCFYRTDLFESATVDRLLGHFERLLEQGARAPERKLAELDLLSREEARQVIYDWNRTERDYPRDRPIHDVFALRAKELPDRAAISSGSATLTYGELDARSDRLARRLRGFGVGHETAVAFCCAGTVERVIAALGILKAGGIYVPLDPDLPAERLDFILADAGVAVVVATASTLPALATTVPCLELGAGGRLVGESPAADPRIEREAAPALSLAYVMYTSGSTGRPKGVGVTHRGVLRLHFGQSEVDLGPDDRVAQASNAAFDASTFEIWGALLHGGQLVAIDQETLLTPAALEAWLRERYVTSIFLTTAVFNQSADARPGIFAGIPWVLTGGDAIDPRRVRSILDAGPPRRLLNGYGPTECTTFACYHRIADLPAVSSLIPIGRPLANTRALVLDAHMRPVPVGIAGELLLGGDGLARGYLNRPGMTASRFVPDPFATASGERLYHTGDRARLLADGTIDFLGRFDHQVKLRGFRVEPGEIESVLRESAEVGDAIVVVLPDAAGDQRLAAYVVPAPQATGGSEPQRREHIDTWQSIYREAYDTPLGDDPSFNTAGWISSYTREPIPAPEMREWVEQTVARIQRLAPRRVLEIGCGTGLLLARLAPSCERYLGTDFAAASEAHCRRLRQIRPDLAHVKLLRRGADDFAGLERGAFDTVILNSIVQYFPDVDYLLRVLDGALELLRPGGRIFVGDVRDRRLLESYYASVHAALLGPSADPRETRRRARRDLLYEEELLLAPELFGALARRHDSIRRVATALKRGRYPNEMTRFRYDVVIERAGGGASLDPRSTVVWTPWQRDRPSLDRIEHALKSAAASRGLGYTGVRNARLTEAALGIRPRGGDVQAIDPEDLWVLGERLGFRVDIGAASEAELFDVRFTPVAEASSLPPFGISPQPAAVTDDNGWRSYANDPLSVRRRLGLEARILGELKEKLPSYMVPASLNVLESLPMTVNRKVDRRALPPPRDSGSSSRAVHVAPRTPDERAVAEIWSEVLGQSQLSVEADFFELGGHSLLATQVVSRLRQRLGLEVPLRDFFEAPTVARLAAHLESLRSTAETPLPPLSRRQRQGPLPLSFAQQRLWFLDQLEGSTPIYNMPSGLRLEGRLDVEALKRSFSEIVRRHEILRTRFPSRDGEPRQDIARRWQLELPIVDLSGLPRPVREAAMDEIRVREAARPFDLARDRPLRVTLIRLAQRCHVVAATLHHIAFDGWSNAVFVRELSAIYAALRQGRPSPLSSPELQYADFALWQREILSGPALERQIAFWRRRLAGAPVCLDLPTDRPRPRVQSFEGRSVPFRLDAELAARLEKLGHRHSASLFMSLLAGFAVLLGRSSRTDDVCVGSPIANRNHRGTEDLIGFFANTLVFRVALERDATYSSLLNGVRDFALDAYAHQDAPFEVLVDQLQPERHRRHPPFFQVLLSVQNYPSDPLELPGLRLTVLGDASATARFDLALYAQPTARGVDGRLHYKTSLFDATSIERLASQLVALLRQAVADPHRQLRRLSWLSTAQRHMLLIEHGQGAPAAGGARSGSRLHELFEAQARRTPEALAVVAEGRALSYGALAARAGHLARRLATLGTGPEQRWGHCLPRGLEAAVALLGILKAGGAYVALDPGDPPARTARLAAEARLSGAVAAPDTADRFADLQRVVELGSTAANAAAPADPACRNWRAGALACLVFTSGSTGRPRGVLVEHRNLAAYVAAIRERLRPRPGERFAVVSTLAADLGQTMLFPAWASGGCVHFLTRERLADADATARYMSTRQFDHLKITPSHLAALTAAARPERVLPRRTLVLGGEASRLEAVARWAALAPHSAIFNHYGPTETTVGVLTHRVRESAAGSGRRTLSLGRPLAGTRAVLLDADLEPSPLGVVGQIFLGGTGVTRGYFHDPAATAERFGPDPIGDEPGERLYRTGDLAVRRADGFFEFLGRVDDQIKVRGFRVEPAEIETALRALPGIREAAVVARISAAGAARLAAYVTTEDGRCDAGAIRRRLGERLPAAMVPADVVGLASLPLTANGKVNRGALPDPEKLPARGAEREGGAPRTPTEGIVQGLWSGLLGVEDFGTGRGFFDLGGHSLLATQLMSRIRRTFQVELPVSAIFEDQTVAGLARRIDAAAGLEREAWRPLPPITRRPNRDRAPLSFAQQRLWFLDRLEGSSATYNISSAMHLAGRLDVAALDRSLTEIVRRHEVLRTTFAEHRGAPVQVVGSPPARTLAVVDLTALPAAARRSQLDARRRDEARRPFDLARGPLLRATLLPTSGERSTLLVSVHHIVSDGWSRGLLLDELGRLYRAFIAGRRSPLPPLPIQYADFAAWQQQALTPEHLRPQIRFWRRLLSGAPQRLELPVTVPRHETAGLQALGRETAGTLFMTLAAAFSALLARYADQDDLVIGSPIAHRNREETEPLIGFFVNTLPVRVDLTRGPSFRQLVERVREVCLGVYANQDLPFEQLVEILQPPRDRSHAPVFQVVFGLQNAALGELRLPGLEITYEDADTESAKFDLLLLVQETRDGLAGVLEYDRDLFDRPSVERLIHSWRHLLSAAVANADRPIEALPMMSPEEARQIAEGWNRTGESYAPERAIAERFAARVADGPEAVALAGDRGECLTYATLHERSRRLARRLRQLGVGRDDLVGLCCERSLDMVVALLGIVEAGAGYLPLDPSYPQSRLDFMIADSRAAVLVARPRLADRFAAFRGRIVELGSGAPGDAGDADDDGTLRWTPPDPANLCYAIYTSGSTGRPKGVLGLQGGALNRFEWMWRRLPFGDGEVMCQKTPLSFLDSLWEIFGPLLGGVRLEIISHEVARDPRRLVDRLAEIQATRLVLVPSLLRAILSTCPDLAEKLPRLAYWFSSGEALTPELRESFAEKLPRATLFNLYGSSEVSADATWHLAAPVAAPAPPSVPIGRPIANLRAHILDRRLRLLPPGVPGEVYIGGVGLARGYLHDPTLTALRFVPDAVSGRRGRRLYRSGDRARHLRDGDIEYLGRAGHRLKVRGFRIEAEEVELALTAHRGVRQAVVVAGEDRFGDTRLSAHLVAAPGEPSPAELRRFLAQRLPDFMIPSLYVHHRALPLTPSGKIDRLALAAADDGATSTGDPRDATPLAPRNSRELGLLRIWESVLGHGQLGVRENFFDRGGHSLMAVRLLAEVERDFGCRLPLSSLFGTAGSIEGMARMLGRVEKAAWTPLVAIQPEGPRPPLFCVHPVGGNVLCYFELARALGTEQPFYGLEARGFEPGEPPCRSLEEMAALYLQAIRAVAPEGPYHLLGWSFGGNVAVEMARQLVERGERVALLALLDSYNAAGRDAARGEDRTADGPPIGADARFLLELVVPDPGPRIAALGLRARRDGLDADRQLELALDEAHREGLVPPEVGMAEIRRVLAVGKANAAMEIEHRPGVLRRLESEASILYFARDSGGRSPEKQSAAWGTVLGGAPRVVMISGNHHTFLRSPHVEAVARDLSRRMDAARAVAVVA